MVQKVLSQNISNYNFNPKYITFSNTVKAEKDNFETQKNTLEIQNKNNKKSKNILIATSALGIASLITLLGVLTKARGLNKKIKNILEKKLNIQEGSNILNMTKLKENATLSTKENKMLKITNFLNNTANIKDCYLLPFLDKIPFLRGFARHTSNIYIQTGIGMTQSAYKHANSAYARFDKKITELLREVQCDDIAELIEKRTKLLSKHFGPENVAQKAAKIEEIMDGVGKRGICIEVRDKFTELIKKALTKRDFKGFGEFVAENMVKKQKSDYIYDLGKIRDEILELDDEIIEALSAKFDKKTIEEILKAKTNAQKTLNNAIRTEGNDLFDKIRDVKIGSAPNDILGMISTTGLLGLYLAQAEDKNQRVEAALTTGVPLGLGMLSTTFATMKMYTGIKALAFGAITTFVANTIGKLINKEYQKRHNITSQELEIPTLDKTISEIKEKVAPKE